MDEFEKSLLGLAYWKALKWSVVHILLLFDIGFSRLKFCKHNLPVTSFFLRNCECKCATVLRERIGEARLVDHGIGKQAEEAEWGDADSGRDQIYSDVQPIA